MTRFFAFVFAALFACTVPASEGCGAGLIPALAAVVSGVTEVAGWVDQIESGINKLGIDDPRIAEALKRVRAGIAGVDHLARAGIDVHSGEFVAALNEAEAAYQALAELVSPHGFAALPGTRRFTALSNGQTTIPTAATVRLTLEGAS